MKNSTSGLVILIVFLCLVILSFIVTVVSAIIEAVQIIMRTT